jgi:hypothetical protein
MSHTVYPAIGDTALFEFLTENKVDHTESMYDLYYKYLTLFENVSDSHVLYMVNLNKGMVADDKQLRQLLVAFSEKYKLGNLFFIYYVH